MSAEPIAGATGLPPEELAVLQRVRQLQTLIEQTGQVGAGGAMSVPAAAGSQASGENFATALQAATGANTASAPVAYTTTAGALQPAGASDGSSQYSPLIEQAAARYGLDPAVLYGLIEQESGFDPSAQSSAGAAGLTQLMPGTAASLGVANPLNPAESIEGGAHYLSQLMAQFGGNVEDALAAYNAGPGAVQQYGGVPPYAETQSYVVKVLDNAQTYRQSHAAAGGGGGLGYASGAPPGASPGVLAYAGAPATNSARTAIAEGHKSAVGESRASGYEQAGGGSLLGTPSDGSGRSQADVRLLGLLDARSRDEASGTGALTGESAPGSPSNAKSMPDSESEPGGAAVLDSAGPLGSASPGTVSGLDAASLSLGGATALTSDSPLGSTSPQDSASTLGAATAPGVVPVLASEPQPGGGFAPPQARAASAGVSVGLLARREPGSSAVPASDATRGELLGALAPPARSTGGPAVGAVSGLPADPLAGPLAVAERGASQPSLYGGTQSVAGIASSGQAVTFSLGAVAGAGAGAGVGVEADAPPALAAGVPMQEIIDSIHATVAMAARQGIAQARIELQPRELGQISIRLSQTSAGLSARVSASTLAGAQALTQGSSELRQSLSSLGVSLLRLDIGSFPQPQAREQGERFGAGAQRSSTSSTSASAEEESLEQIDSTTAPLTAARGEIVDVLA